MGLPFSITTESIQSGERRRLLGRLPHTVFIGLLSCTLAFAGALGTSEQQATSGKQAAPEPESPEEKRALLPSDPNAKALLKEVQEADPGWGEDFPGFTADVEIFWDGSTHRGSVTVRNRNKVALSFENAEAKQWVNEVVSSMIANAFRDSFDAKYAKLGVTFGKDDLNPLGQLLLVHGDRYETGYRIKDNEIRQILRANGERVLTIDILSVERDEQGRKLAQTYAAQYFSKEKMALQKTQTVQEGKVAVGDYLLPGYHYEVVNEDGGSRTRSIRFSNHSLLSPSNVQRAKENKGAGSRT
jgi:hypothetical protein